jgi:tryptophanyl-tRNA synthetase
MSASDANSAIYVTDSAKEIKTKVCPGLYFFGTKIFTKQLHD